MERAVQPKNIKWIVAGLMLFTALLSVFILAQQSLRLDEAQSLFQTSHSVSGIIQIISEDVHVPLYHILLHFWQKIWGNGVFAARILSLVFYVGSIPLVYLIGNLLYGRKVSLFATTLMAISPFLNWFGNEIRMYSMLMFITLINQYFFIRIYKDKDSAYTHIPKSTQDEELKIDSRILWTGYGLSALVGIFTHYFFFLVLGAQGIFIAMHRKSFSKKSIQNFMKTATALALSFVPWIYLVVSTDKLGYYQPLLTKPKIVDVFNSFSQFLFGFHNDTTNTLIVSLWPLIGLLLFLMLSKRTMPSRDTVYMFITVTLPIVAAFLISLTFQPLFLSRYFIIVVPSLYLLLGWLLSTYSAGISKTVGAFIIVGMAAGLTWQIINSDTPVKEGYQQANDHLREHTTAQDVVVVSPPFTIYPTEYYYDGPAAIRTLPQWDRLIVGPIPQFSQETLPGEVEELAGSHERMWLLVSDMDQGYEEDLVFYFETNFERLEKIEVSPNLTLYAYKMRYDIPENLRAALDEVENRNDF